MINYSLQTASHWPNSVLFVAMALGELREGDPVVMAHCLFGSIAACGIAASGLGSDPAGCGWPTWDPARLAEQIVDGFLAGWARQEDPA